MKKRFLLILCTCFLVFTAMADILIPGEPRHPRAESHGANRPHMSFEQFQQNKCDFIINELGLSADLAEKFIPVYKQLLEAKSALYHKYGGSHRIMRSVSEGQQMPDSVMQRAAKDSRQLQLEDAKLEQEYLSKFETILSPVQIIKLQEAEQKFKNEMMKRGPRPNRQR